MSFSEIQRCLLLARCIVVLLLQNKYTKLEKKPHKIHIKLKCNPTPLKRLIFLVKIQDERRERDNCSSIVVVEYCCEPKAFLVHGVAQSRVNMYAFDSMRLP